MLKALVLGGSDKVFQEAEAALKLFTPDAVFVVNDMIHLWPDRIDYICSLHPEKVDDWLRKRKFRGYPMGGAEVWAHKKQSFRAQAIYTGVDKITDEWAGSSGLFATKIALQEGFAKIVIAGIPMERNEGHIERKHYFAAADAFRNGWKARAKRLELYVRSMSGWTQKLLGAPTPEWLDAAIAPSPLHAEWNKQQRRAR